MLGAAGWMLYSALSDSLVYFILPNEYAREVNQYEGRRIRLGGIVSPESMDFDEQAVRLNFTEVAAGGNRRPAGDSRANAAVE